MSYSNEIGIRDGEVFNYVGNSDNKDLQGTRVKFHSALNETTVYPPFFIPSTQTIRDSLNVIPFFSEMDVDERKEYFIKNKAKVKRRIDQTDNVLIEFETLNYTGDSVSPEKVFEFLNPNPARNDGYWDLKEFVALFPTPSGAPQMFMRGNFWEYYINPRSATVSNGVIIRPNTGTTERIRGPTEVNSYGHFNMMTDEDNNSAFYDFVKSILEEYPMLTERLSWLTPSGHKSLIQKLIRTRASLVKDIDTEYDAEDVLKVSFCMLMLMPGSLNPDIQVYVTGFQAATKRLAVSIIEDGYVEEAKIPLSLLASSLYSRDNKSWKPSNDTVMWWIDSAIVAMNSGRYYKYDCHYSGQLTDKPSKLSYCSVIMDELKSFSTDLAMFRSVANNYGTWEENNSGGYFEMNIFHFIDHHCYPDFMYLLDDTGLEFTQIVRDVWDLVSGINNRKRQYEPTPYSENIVNAQRRAWVFKTQQHDSHSIYFETAESIVEDVITHIQKKQYRMPDSILSSLIGTFEFKISNFNYLAFAKPDDIYEFKAIKTTIRTNKNEKDKTQEEKDKQQKKESESAVRVMKGKLNDGVTKNTPGYLNIPSPITIFFEQGEYWIRPTNGASIPWNIFRNIIFTPDIVETSDVSTDSCISLRDSSMFVHDARDRITNLLDDMDTKALGRLIVFLRMSKSSVELNRFKRDGTGLVYVVKRQDASVANFLQKLCCLLPCLIEMESFSSFKIKNYTVFIDFKTFIIKRILFLLDTAQDLSWNVKSDKDNRMQRPWQKYSTEKLLEKYESGSTASILVLETGSGKSKIATDVLKGMIKRGKMPPYCVWAIPNSAIKSVIKEIETAGFDYKYVNFRGKKPDIPSKYVTSEYEKGLINIVDHDKMKNITNSKLDVESMNMKIAPDTFFIFDEIHKAFASSKRASAAIGFASSSRFFLGMTATLIPGSDVKVFQRWLQMMVEFDVNSRNQWLGVAALVTSKVNTGVLVEDKIIEAKMNPHQKREYYKLVPSGLGGSAVSINLREAKRVCDEVTDIKIALLSAEYIKKGVPVFVVADNTSRMENILIMTKVNMREDLRVFKIQSGSTIVYSSDSKDLYDMVITTKSQSEGYTVSKIHIMITGVYFSNQATRTQLRGRLARLGQKNKVTIITVTTGILSYVNEKYKKVESLNQLVSALSKEFKVENTD